MYGKREVLADFAFVADNQIFSRYVKSLYEVAVKKGIHNDIVKHLNEIKSFILAIDNHKKFLKRLSMISLESTELINIINEKFNIPKELENFLHLLVKNKKIGSLVEICDGYATLVDQMHGKKVFHITYAKTFSEHDEKNLIKKLQLIFDGTIECVSKKDPSLIDGIQIRYLSKMLDYSLKSKLERLRYAIRGENYEN